MSSGGGGGAVVYCEGGGQRGGVSRGGWLRVLPPASDFFLSPSRLPLLCCWLPLRVLSSGWCPLWGGPLSSPAAAAQPLVGLSRPLLRSPSSS